MSTIQVLKAANIQFWVLTGDKVETVSSIAISTGLKSKDSIFFFLREITNQEKLVQQLNQFSQINVKKILVVDGHSLQLAIETNEWFFVQTANKADGVICCRCSPTQKA